MVMVVVVMAVVMLIVTTEEDYYGMISWCVSRDNDGRVQVICWWWGCCCDFIGGDNWKHILWQK